MKVAVVGAGISGLTAAYYLQNHCELTVYESAGQIGGHTATVDVRVNGENYAVDTGFIVYNDWTYPRFIELLDILGVDSQPTEMSFSVRNDEEGLEYGGSNLNTLFAQRRNLLNPGFWGMLKDILRFNREAAADLAAGYLAAGITLGEYLRIKGYGRVFINRYLVPMGSAIWSAETAVMLDFPLLFFVRFFNNHGLLSVNDRPQWRVLKGGSKSYLEPLTRGFRNNIVTAAGISAVRRETKGARISFANGATEHYDQVIMACHSDQALALLQDASQAEWEVLGAIPYRDNDVVLHTDSRLLPRNRRAWSSWNYWQRSSGQSRPVLTYNMNILQGLTLTADTTICVTLNATDAIDPDKILGRYCYSHPVFSLTSVQAVSRWEEINGVRDTWFCGAYWGNGFHEDGVASGLRVAQCLLEGNRVV